METKRLGPREFTQSVAINPPSQIFLFTSAITMPMNCNSPLKLGKKKVFGNSLKCIFDKWDIVSRERLPRHTRLWTNGSHVCHIQGQRN